MIKVNRPIMYQPLIIFVINGVYKMISIKMVG